MAEVRATVDKTSAHQAVDRPSVQTPVDAEENGGAAPRHVAIIMDGNHRWAKRRHLPGAAGHRAGARNVRPVAEACADANVEILTLFAFSTENWQRPSREVNLLLDLMRNVLDNDIEELNQRGVRLRIIGDRSRFASDLQMRMNRAEAATRENRQMTLNIAANFGGRWDIARAARLLAGDVASGRLAADDVNEDVFSGYLSLGDVPAPDICIRTGGEARISNFLLWDFAYTELYFTEAFWPEFNAQELAAALSWFQERQRRFGRRQ